MTKLIFNGLVTAFIAFFIVTILLLFGSKLFHLIFVPFKIILKMAAIGGIAFSLGFNLLIILIAYNERIK